MLITVAGFKGGVGKTTSAVHLACYFAKKGDTLLVDGDPNRSATGWNKREQLPFKVVDLMQAALYSPKYEHIVIDTAARPNRDELEALADGCNLLVLLILPSTNLMHCLSIFVYISNGNAIVRSDKMKFFNKVPNCWSEVGKLLISSITSI